MTFSVWVTAGAQSDVRLILHWLSERSPAGADAWYHRWLETLDQLQRRADSAGLAPESEDHPEAIRQVLFKTRRGRNYRALFVIRDRDVFVLHVRGPGQDYLRPEEIRSPD